MCGFLVLIGDLPAAHLAAAGNLIRHRGPDSHHTLERPGLHMAFHRLAIIDTATRSDQPMMDDTGQVSISFNGEIYNYKNLRSQLVDQGCTFKTQGDTEVILNGYKRYGIEFVNRLEGMFALVIHDASKGKAYAARDHLGIKPLYFYAGKGTYAYASEQRPIRKLFNATVDRDSVAELILFRWATAPRSNYTGIELVEPGTYHEIDLQSRSISRKRYYDLSQSFNDRVDLSVEEAIEYAEAALRDSVKAHLTSDVGAALLLSGGVDSSFVGAVASQLQPGMESYGIAFPGMPHDESQYQLAVAEAVGLKHHLLPMSGHDVAEAMARAVYHMDGPLPHYGCCLLYLAYQQIKPHASVVLTGEGADELFGGYRRYIDIDRFTRYHMVARWVPEFVQNLLPRFRAVWHHGAVDPAISAAVYQDFRAAMSLATSVSPGAMVLRDLAAQVSLEGAARWFYLDQATYLPSLLMRQDRMSMAHGVEARVPFVHRPLIDKINALPSRTKLFTRDTKPILKTIARKYLPKAAIDRRKIGLTLPLAEWVRDGQPLAPLKDACLAAGAPIQDYVSREALLGLQRGIQSGISAEAKMSGDILANLININCWLEVQAL